MLLIVFCGAAIVVVAAIGVLATLRDRKASVEQGLEPVHECNCGARVGDVNWSIPFVRLALYRSFMVISYAKKIVVSYDAIERLFVDRYILNKGLRVVHHDCAIPEYLMIWSTDVENLQKTLAALVRSHSIDRNDDSMFAENRGIGTDSAR